MPLHQPVGLVNRYPQKLGDLTDTELLSLIPSNGERFLYRLLQVLVRTLPERNLRRIAECRS